MEILTTGEKIKRARIYKGLTLKELCSDKLSVSKLSCIENDKLNTEPQMLKYIAERLDMDFEYLMESIKDQIKNNMKRLANVKDPKVYEEEIQYNFAHAFENEHFNLAFELMHLLFIFYLDNGKNENVQVLTSKYYDVCTKSDNAYNSIIYFKDMARYFFINNEFDQAAAYYNNVKQSLRKSDIKASKVQDYEVLAEIIYNETLCYVMMENFDEAYDKGMELKDLEQYVQDNIKKAEMYELLAILCLKKSKEKFRQYEEKAYVLYDNNLERKAAAMYNFALNMFKEGIHDDAIKYIELGLQTYPEANIEGRVSYLMQCVSELVKNDILDLAQRVCDEALNLAILLDKIKYIERGYYYKSVILQKQQNYISAEMYMNLSLDALFKFGNKIQRYDRYLEVANMYHKLGQVSDSLKYFSLALLMEKKL